MIYVTHLCGMLKCPTHTRHKAFSMMTFNELLIKYMKTLFQSNDINVFKLTGSKKIGLKFSGKLGSPFLWIKMVVTLVRCAGRVLLLRTSVQISIINGLKYGYCLKQIINIWSNGHGRTRGFHALDNSCNLVKMAETN